MNCVHGPHHIWVYRKGKSECMRCGRRVNDWRGLPHGHYAINGSAILSSVLTGRFACPTCLANITQRVVNGQLRVLCVGEDEHDIEKLGRAMTKFQRDRILHERKEIAHAK